MKENVSLFFFCLSQYVVSLQCQQAWTKNISARKSVWLKFKFGGCNEWADFQQHFDKLMKKFFVEARKFTLQKQEQLYATF